MAAPVDVAEEIAGGTEPANLLAVVGAWTVQKDGSSKVLTVDGSRWREGTASALVSERAAALFPADAKAFADAVGRHASFPLAIVKDVPSFVSGTVTVHFKPIAGREDQAAGIAFAIQPNGDYLILRANALEDNLVLFQFKNGRRSTVKEVSRVPTKSGEWHELRLVIEGLVVKGSVDGKAYLQNRLDRSVAGRVGLWSKADSVVQFRDLDIQTVPR